MAVETLQAKVRLRPTRIGFIVDPTDMLSMRRIMHYNTCLWGGLYNPIIPYSDALPAGWQKKPYSRPTGIDLAKRYIEFFEPDVFVDATGRAAADLGYADDKIEFRQHRAISLDELFAFEKHSRQGPKFGLFVVDIYRHLYQKAFQFQHREQPRFAVFDSAVDIDSAADAMFGIFPADDHLKFIGENFRKLTNSDPISLSSDLFEDFVSGKLHTAFDLTSYKLDIDVSNVYDPTFYIFDPASPEDLVDLWNLRITTRDMIPVPVTWLSMVAEFIREIIKGHHRPIPHNPFGTMLTSTVEFAGSISEERSRAIIDEHFKNLPQGAYGYKTWYTSIWYRRYDDMISQPQAARITAEERDVELILTDEERLSAWIDVPSPRFADRFGITENHVRWVNVLSARPLVPDNDFAACFPKKDRIVTDHKNYTLRQSLVAREGIILFQHFKNIKGLVYWARGREAVVDWLHSCGIKAIPSEAGIIAAELIKAVGYLYGVRLLADERTIGKLDKMAATEAIREGGQDRQTTIRGYPDRTAPAREWQSFMKERATRSLLARHDLLYDLTKANVLRLGLQLICSHCQKRNWYGVDELPYMLTCGRCLKKYNFPQGDLNNDNLQWHYRVIGPFSVPDFASGGYAVALTLRVFALGLSVSDVKTTYSTGIKLELPCGEIVEADFLMWFQRQRQMQYDDKPVIVFGEAKSFGERAFKRIDIDRLKRLAELFPGSYIVLSCLKRDLSSDEREIIGELVEWGKQHDENRNRRCHVIILTGNELFFEWGLHQTWDDNEQYKRLIGERYINLTNLENVARVTQALYLNTTVQKLT